jgi:aminopeptidase N
MVIPWIWTLSEPYGAPDWWPCKDNPTDKADSIDVWVTCDENFKAGSQGKLISVTSAGPGFHTYHWKHRYPISTYLVSVALTDYAEFSDWYKYAPGDSMEILNYVIPPVATITRSQLGLTVPMLEIFSDLYGLYPFVTEKYGHSQFGWGGGMEHQTMTSLGKHPTFGFTEDLVAHELAHQWFGDMITMKTWPDIWLNEGFATYSVALYRERRYGKASSDLYMASRILSVLAVDAGSVYVSDTTNISSLFSGRLVYNKGACVLKMLRYVVGDSLFFAAMKSYATDSRFRFKNASTGDLKGVFENVSGKDLGYFFQQWIYGEGFPNYYYEWGWVSEGSGSRVRLSLSQTSGTNPVFFTMPLDIRISGGGADTTITVTNDSASQAWVWSLPFAPESLVIDPDNRILKTIQGSLVNVNDVGKKNLSFALDQNYPNPFNPATMIRYTVPVRSRVRMEIIDLLGRLVTVLIDREMEEGRYEVGWRPEGASGVYICRMTAIPSARPSEALVRVRKMVFVK